MSKVRINDLAREMEVKSRQILDVLAELGLGAGKTHSSSLEADEAEKVRAHIEQERALPATPARVRARRAGHNAKIDLSHISKPGDVIKAVLAKKREEEEEARHAHVPARPAAACRDATLSCPRRQLFPRRSGRSPGPPRTAQDRSPTPLRAAYRCSAAAPPAIASRPPAGPVIAKAPAGAVAATRPVVVVKPPAAPIMEAHARTAKSRTAAKLRRRSPHIQLPRQSPSRSRSAVAAATFRR